MGFGSHFSGAEELVLNMALRPVCLRPRSVSARNIHVAAAKRLRAEYPRRGRGAAAIPARHIHVAGRGAAAIPARHIRVAAAAAPRPVLEVEDGGREAREPSQRAVLVRLPLVLGQVRELLLHVGRVRAVGEAELL